MAEISHREIMALRHQLQCDAEKAKLEGFPEQMQQWIEPRIWSQYMGPTGKKLSQSFSDEELLDIIRQETLQLGHVPAQREVFCVYRDYIRRRFGNWIKAIRAAGLQGPGHHRVN